MTSRGRLSASDVDWASIGAFLSGVGAVATAYWFVKAERKRLDEECQQRLDAFREGLHEREHD